MKKTTVTKWIFASAAMLVAFACQSSSAPEKQETPEEDNSSCPCHSKHASAGDAFTKNHTASNDEIIINTEDEKASQFVIEIDDPEEVGSMSLDTPADEVPDSTIQSETL